MITAVFLQIDNYTAFDLTYIYAEDVRNISTSDTTNCTLEFDYHELKDTSNIKYTLTASCEVCKLGYSDDGTMCLSK